MTYTINDLKILEEDTTPDNPQMMTPKFEVPGEIFNQDYPKRLRHSFPNTDKWEKTVDVDGNQVPRWKQYLFQHYIEKNV